MADRPRGGKDPEESEGKSFDWLYGTHRKGIGSDSEPVDETLPGQPEPTRILKRPIAPTPPGPPPSARGLETRDRSGRTVSAAPPLPKPAKKRIKLHPGRWLVLLLVLWLAFMLAVPIFAWTKIDKVDAEPQGARPADQPGTTYLLVGSDSREGLTRKQRRKLHTGGASGQRTDSIMLLHTGDGPDLLMSIPRDSIVPVPGHGTTKINAAFAYGGPPLLVQTIEDNTGIRVDAYVEIGFGGFVKMVNAVDGITICPKTRMDDVDAGLHVKAGCQPARGRKALAYARSRHAQQLGDIDRALHQREVVAAIGAKATKPGTFLNPFRYYRLSFASADSFSVGDDVSSITFAKFALAMRKVSGKDGLTCGIPISDLAVHWDEDRSKRLFSLIKQDRTSDIGRGLCQKSGLPK